MKFLVVEKLNSLRALTTEIFFMKLFTQKLHDELLKNLEEADKNYSPKNIEDRRLDLIVTTINEIKEKLKSYQFASEKEEIKYFKCILPEILLLHIYYTHVVEWDRIIRKGSDKTRYDFYDNLFTIAENFRADHKLFYDYCRNGNSDLDGFYFLRSSPLNRDNIYPLRIIIDPASPTTYCEILATFLAHARLESELHQSLTGNRENAINPTPQSPLLTWTLPKINLIEIIYAFKEAAAFNHGKADLKTIVECFEKMFGIPLVNISRSFQEIMSRKMGYTSFIDQLKESLLKKIDNIEKGNIS
jgi:hypothetical protein